MRENIARYLRTGQVDTLYLSGLSPNAVPAIVASLPVLPEPNAGVLREAFQWRYSASAETPACRSVRVESAPASGGRGPAGGRYRPGARPIRVAPCS